MGDPIYYKTTIEYLLDTSIDYYVKLSFENFKEIIDHIGGVEVNALKDFPNNNKPIVTKGKATTKWTTSLVLCFAFDKMKTEILEELKDNTKYYNL